MSPPRKDKQHNPNRVVDPKIYMTGDREENKKAGRKKDLWSSQKRKTLGCSRIKRWGEEFSAVDGVKQLSPKQTKTKKKTGIPYASPHSSQKQSIEAISWDQTSHDLLPSAGVFGALSGGVASSST